VLLGTSLTYYATYMPSYSHAMDAFACAAFLAYWGLTQGRSDARRWAVLGLLLGFATLVRIQELALGIVVALEVAWRVIAAARARTEPWLPIAKRYVAGGALVLVVTFVMFIPQLWEWHVVFGDATALPQGARYTRGNAPMIPELLYSARNGWFTTTPIAYAGCLGLLTCPRRFRLIGIGLLLAVAIEVYLSSTVLDWWSSASFGQRRLCNMTLPLVFGLACLLHRAGGVAARWRRVPRAVWHVVFVAIFGCFVTWNLVSVRSLSGGKPASDQLTPTCCDHVFPPLRGVAGWFYDRVGNPLEFPANVVFAWTHDVPISRWDEIAGGAYPLQPALADLRDDERFFRTRGAWHIGSPGIEPYLISGWSASQRIRDRQARRTTEPAARVLVPNLMPDGQRMTLWLTAGDTHHAIIEWNGDLVADLQLTEQWTPVVFDLPDIGLHTNELTVRGDAPGVAVGDLQVELLHP
jgi:hypothetical protein